jgi:hypothetical protein
MAEKMSFLLYMDDLELLEELTMEERGQLLTAVYCHTAGLELPEMSSTARVAFIVIRKKLDRDAAKYAQQVAKNHANGSKGGRPKKNPENPVGFSENPENPGVFLKTQKTQDKDKDKDKDKDEDKDEYLKREIFNEHWKTSTRARAATAQQVIDLMEERGNAVSMLADLHDVLFKAMSLGISPEEILDAAGRRDAMMFSVWLADKGVLDDDA